MKYGEEFIGKYVRYITDGEVCEIIGINESGRLQLKTKHHGVCGEALQEHGGDVVLIKDKTPALTSTTHVLKIEHKFKVTKTIDNAVQLELQHGVYSKDNVQELIDILVKVKEEM